jgi:hypothetical protein
MPMLLVILSGKAMMLAQRITPPVVLQNGALMYERSKDLPQSASSVLWFPARCAGIEAGKYCYYSLYLRPIVRLKREAK